MIFQSGRLIEAMCEGPWPDASLLPGYNLMVIDTQRTFIVKGGPFFTLNLEYFVSLMGAVLTYFVVLVQFKD
jgi:hypothetical protein